MKEPYLLVKSLIHVRRQESLKSDIRYLSGFLFSFFLRKVPKQKDERRKFFVRVPALLSTKDTGT